MKEKTRNMLLQSLERPTIELTDNQRRVMKVLKTLGRISTVCLDSQAVRVLECKGLVVTKRGIGRSGFGLHTDLTDAGRAWKGEDDE